MNQVGVSQARKQLARLLREVERGESVVITRHGRQVARLVPVEGDRRRRDIEEVIEEMREFRRTHSLGGLKIKDLIEEGRR